MGADNINAFILIPVVAMVINSCHCGCYAHILKKPKRNTGLLSQNSKCTTFVLVLQLHPPKNNNNHTHDNEKTTTQQQICEVSFGRSVSTHSFALHSRNTSIRIERFNFEGLLARSLCPHSHWAQRCRGSCRPPLISTMPACYDTNPMLA